MLGDSWIGVVFRIRAVLVLWRRVAQALGQVLACLAYGGACLAGGGADVGDRGAEGVLPEVRGCSPAAGNAPGTRGPQGHSPYRGSASHGDPRHMRAMAW